ncbi:polyphosphate kinase 2 family protein [Microvirga lotononidis]|uniref:Polyphosphate:nucleotide phosphotransferase, PPK2 family n=1 Tax=Microvirga lotononidis TaxID=864069 RepID=I4YW47_9HYPH|nr:polyphosphate kinase 2 family protein [Microvirga lotononidis]EIM28189.1 polyphosphate:nucleotide phosphotransferase, PPK2 family [Microvirga lotononidis]WQO27712.1 polyphosphate kinase 2 family protein [Microvirga lotononidis]
MADQERTLLNKLRVEPDGKVRLKDWNPRDKSLFKDEEETKVATAALAKDIDILQDRLYAEGTRSLLVILQGMDTSGKDGTIRGVFNATGPLGVSVHAFGPPTRDELEHDYLWRVHEAVPRRGTIGIFNRSHYEDVLIGRVRKLAPDKVIEQRYEQINAFEKMLAENGTTILKFMLHISKDEQKERLQERLDDPTKHWKFNPSDLEDRQRWDEYQEAYEIMLNRCSTKWAPWHVIPADRKWVRNAAIASIVKATLEEMDPQYPKVSWKPGDFKIE